MKITSKWGLVGFIMMLFISTSIYCSPAQKVRKYGAYISNLDSFADFEAMQGAPLSNKFNDVHSVKLVYDLHSKRLYFINSPQFRYHYEFCSNVLYYQQDLNSFNADNYGNSKYRDYLLANLNFYPKQNVYTLEFVSDDRINEKQLATFYDAIETHSYLKDSLKLLVNTAYLMAMDSLGQLPMPKIYPTTLYNNQKYQALNNGISYGYLRFVKDIEKDYKKVKPQDIIIIKGTPANVPVCSGIITNSYQTPLSHINILCHNRNIPSAVDVNIWKDKSWAKFIDKPVRLFITDDSINITASDAATVANFIKKHQDKPVVKLKFDLSKRKLSDINDISIKDKNVVGNKAAGLGELNKISKYKGATFSIPEGAFAIPFYYYQQHVQQESIRYAINTLMNTKDTASADSIKHQLKRIRQLIKEAPLNKELLATIISKIKTNNVGNSYRFRSSSNAEDNAGFSGAGLYDSKTGILGDTSKSIEHALKSVWASAWSDAAFEEREWYHISQLTSMMGVLVHRNFPDEISNGVAITRNLYRSGFPGFTVNVQFGETSVVSPPDSITCEQFICMNSKDMSEANKDITVDYITFSNLNIASQKVLTKQQIDNLYYALANIKAHYYWNAPWSQKDSYEDFAMDIEFKFDKNNKLYIKQARPYR